MKVKILLGILTLALIFSCSMPYNENSGIEQINENSTDLKKAVYSDYRAPSQDPPGGLAVSEVPQLIILGFDDNQFADGMNNVISIYDNKYNPSGSGNTGTFDGNPVHVSFYFTPGGTDGTITWTVGQDTIDSWISAYQKGHEVGNHTFYHGHGTSYSVAKWVTEMTDCTNFLVSNIGIPESQITGFRTPFLEYSASTFAAMKQVGLAYDVSFEGGWRYWPAEDGSTLYWPFTMDDGKPPYEEGKAFGNEAGIWEIPDDCIFFPDGARTTGLDYNMWFSKQCTKTQFVNALKHSLDKKYNGNRSPMNFGLHSNYYSADGEEEMKIYDPASYAKLKANLTERQQALAEFLNYALSLPDVRIVSAQEALEWIKNPVALGGTSVDYTITANSGPNGNISPSGNVTVLQGANKSFSFPANSGYEIDTVTIDGSNIGSPSSYTFNNVQTDHTINVTFKISTVTQYTITASTGTNGSITPSGSITVNEGTNQTFNFSPASGYEVNSVIVDGTNVDSPSSFTFDNVQSNHTISVSFSISSGCTLPDWDPGEIYTGGDQVHHAGHNWEAGWWTQGQEPGTTGEWGVWDDLGECGIVTTTYTISASSGANGSISPSGDITVNEGANQTFAFSPNAGYEINSVITDGSNLGVLLSYTFSNVQGNHSISVTFVPTTTTQYTITASAGANGSISPSGSITVNEGTNQTFNFSPAGGYIVDAVTVDGSNIGSPSSYTFPNVTANHTISVTFIASGTPAWEVGVHYTMGAMVTYNGKTWQNTYDHISNSAWYPGAPGLWFWTEQ